MFLEWDRLVLVIETSSGGGGLDVQLITQTEAVKSMKMGWPG
jgi:hypothetical protein